jgi:hypothetical protein
LARFILLIAAIIAPATIAAQTPAPAPPATASLSGVVRGLGGAPLPDVDVSLIGETGGTHSDSTGHFVLRGITAGGHTALFRRIGRGSVEYRWTARAGRDLQVTVTMAPAAQQLDRVVVEAPGLKRRLGTSTVGGRVVDASDHAVVGADVRLLGTGLSTISDSSGGFTFQSIPAGPYIVRARRRDLQSASYPVQIADDDNRDGITLKMHAFLTGERDPESAAGYGAADVAFDEFDHRERANPAERVIGPADLFRADRAPMDFVLQQYRDRPAAHSSKPLAMNDGSRSVEDGDCLLVDGRRAIYQPLSSYSSSDVQLVEVFHAGSFADQTVVSHMDGISQCQGTMDHHPTYFVLWTRWMR